MKETPQSGLSNKDKYKLFVLFGAFLTVITISYISNKKLQSHAIEDAKIKVVKANYADDSLIEFSEEFVFTPDYAAFFDVEDELDSTIEHKVSKGELDIRNSLGSSLYRAHPKLVQKKTTPADYKKIINDSNPNKGQIFWVAGKVLGIRDVPKNEEISSAQFVHIFEIESADGGFYECQSIRSAKDVRIGDIIYMNGIYLKLHKHKKDDVVAAVLLGNSIQKLLPLPAMWENNETYAKHLKEINDTNLNLIKIPKELDVSIWKNKFDKDLIANEDAWSKVNDKVEEESQKLSPELEARIISDMSTISNTTLLDLVDSKSNANFLLKVNEQKRRSIIKIVGKIESVIEAYLPTPINGIEKVYYSKIKDLRGNFFYYNSLNPVFVDQADKELWKDSTKDPKDAVMLIPKEGDIVICTGTFVQNVKEGETKKTKIPLIYGKLLAVIGDYNSIWNSVDHGGKRTAETGWSGDAKEAGIIERMPFSYLLSKVSYTNSKEMIKNLMSTPSQDRITYEKMMKEPENTTDKLYIRFGKMLLIKKIEGTHYYDFHGVKDVYEIYFCDIDNNLFTIICPDIVEGAELNHRMTFTGYFLKRTAFVNKDGTITWTPYLVGYIDDIEKVVVKKMSKVEKIICVILSLGTIGLVIYLNIQFVRSRTRKNPTLSANIQNAKNRNVLFRQLTEKGSKLEQIIIGYFHHTLIEDLPIPLELCKNIDHWPKLESGLSNTLLRPESLKSSYEAIVRHYKEFGNEIPKDIKTLFFNNRKELLGLRAFQNSKFEITDVERTRPEIIMIIPLSFIVSRPENLDRMDGYLDEYGLPPWNTWIKIGKMPKYLLRNSAAAYSPETLVVVCYLPSWMVEKAKQQFTVIVKEKKAVDIPGEEE